MDDGSITLLAALIILVAFSAFFSASETAFSSLNQIRLKSRAEDGDSAAARVLAMSEKYDKLLSTILIGNNIVNIAAASIGTVLFTRLLDPERGATVSTFVLTIVVLIFGEVTPKSLAKEMPETVATAVSPFLNLLMILFTPLTWLFTQWKRLLGHFIHSTEEDTITEGELMTMVSEAENDGELTDRESQLIRSAIEFDDVEVEDTLQLISKSVFTGNIEALFQRRRYHLTMLLPVFPKIRAARVLAAAGVGNIKYISEFGLVAAGIHKGDALAASPHIAAHLLIPKVVFRAGRGFRALGENHELFIVGVLIQPCGGGQKCRPLLVASRDLLRRAVCHLRIELYFTRHPYPPFQNRGTGQASHIPRRSSCAALRWRCPSAPAAPFHPQRGSRAFPPAPRSSPCGCRCCRGS